MKFVLPLLFCILIFLPLVYSIGFQVEPKSKECFSEIFDKQRKVKLNWQVTRGGLLDINVIVKYEGRQNNLLQEPDILFEKLYFEKDHGPGQFDFVAKQPGIYTVCFDNSMARFTAKVVKYDYILHNKWGTPEDDDDSDDPLNFLQPMEKSANRIGEELEALSVHQQYLRNREMRHLWTQRSTNGRIFWMSLLESIILLGISFAQVFYIKRFFKNRNDRLI